MLELLKPQTAEWKYSLTIPTFNIVKQNIFIIVVWIFEAVRFGLTGAALKDKLSELNKCVLFLAEDFP